MNRIILFCTLIILTLSCCRLPFIDVIPNRKILSVQKLNSEQCAAILDVGATMFYRCRKKPRSIHIYIPHASETSISNILATYPDLSEISHDKVRIIDGDGRSIPFATYPADQDVLDITVMDNSVTKKSGLMMYLTYTTMSETEGTCETKLAIFSN